MRKLMKVFLSWVIFLSSVVAVEKTNFLIITADDMNWDSVGCYGSAIKDITPNIDRLAGQGLRFSDAHVASTACYPSRSAINTGRLPHRSGGEGFHYLRFPNIPTIPKVLKSNGYRVGILGKVHHSTPYENTPWDSAQEIGRNTEEFYTESAKFIDDSKKAGKPFYLIVNSHDPHRPYYNIASAGKPMKGRQGKVANSHPSKVYKASDVPIPNTLPDHPDVRRELACYYSSVRRFDDVVGRLLQLVKDKDLSKNTVIIFLSDHGMGMPSAKANVYLNSTKVPFIIRWDKHIAAASIDSKNIISSLDIFPTILDIAGIKSPGGFDGKSLVPLFKGAVDKDRQRIHTQFHTTSGKSYFQMRNSQTKKYAFIFNAWYNGKPTYKSSSMGGFCFKTMLELGKKDSNWAKRCEFLLVRSPEEFYDLEKDPGCLNNLIQSAEYKNKVAEFRQEMSEWLKKSKDPMSVVFEDYIASGSVQQLSESFAKVHTAQKYPGKVPKPVNMDVWTDPDYKNKKRGGKKKATSDDSEKNKKLSDEERKKKRAEKRLKK